jgi:hypothetical protein
MSSTLSCLGLSAMHWERQGHYPWSPFYIEGKRLKLKRCFPGPVGRKKFEVGFNTRIPRTSILNYNNIWLSKFCLSKTRPCAKRSCSSHHHLHHDSALTFHLIVTFSRTLKGFPFQNSRLNIHWNSRTPITHLCMCNRKYIKNECITV